MDTVRFIRRIGLDIALWYCAPAAFLALYVLRYSKPAAAIAPHLHAISLPLIALLAIRIGLAAVFRHRRRAYLFAATLVTALFVAALLVYYALVLIALRSWGDVIAWNVIPSFFEQADEMADSLGLSSTLAALLPLPFGAAIISLCWWYLSRFDWAHEFVRSRSSLLITTLATCGLAVLAIGCFEFTADPALASQEPLSLTLFPQERGSDLEGLTLDPVRASRLDRLQAAARARYKSVPGAHRNLILIVVDALRPDHMGIYGYSRDTTPNLARIVARHPTQIFREVHSSCADTICGLYSLFSSRFPQGFSFHPMTLHEVLRRNGYRVELVLSGDHTYFYSLKGLYGRVDSFYDGTQARGYFINDDRLVTDHLASINDWDGKPVMFQFHLMSAHILRKRDSRPGRFQPAVRYALHGSRDIGPGGSPLETAVNFYDNGVVDADAIINTLLETLERKGFLKDALVVITADHGESLGEHGLFVHANSVREEVLRIPLVFISYGYQPQYPAAIRPFPSQIDIAPTILVDLGLPVPQSWDGLPLQEPQAPAYSYFEEHAYAGLIDHRDPRNVWKYWIDRSTQREFVFDLSTDPHENHDMHAAAAGALLAAWRAQLSSPAQQLLAHR